MVCLQVTCLGESVSTLVTFHLSVWAPDQLGGGWGREDGGRGFGLGGPSPQSTVCRRAPRLWPDLSSTSPPPLRGEGSFQAEKMGGEREGRYVESQAFCFSAVLPMLKPTGKWQEVIPPPLMAVAKTKLAPCQFKNNPKIGKGTACVSAPKVILCIQHKLQEWIFF